MKAIKIFTDGGSRGNPGPGASAFVVVNSDKTIATGSKYLGEVTNNTAEYSAVILALDWLLTNFKKLTVQNVNFVLDSELVVRQLNGVYKVKNDQIKILFDMVKAKLSNIPCEFTFSSVSRDKNKEADKLVNETLDKSLRKI